MLILELSIDLLFYHLSVVRLVSQRSVKSTPLSLLVGLKLRPPSSLGNDDARIVFVLVLFINANPIVGLPSIGIQVDHFDWMKLRAQVIDGLVALGVQLACIDLGLSVLVVADGDFATNH